MKTSLEVILQAFLGVSFCLLSAQYNSVWGQAYTITATPYDGGTQVIFNNAVAGSAPQAVEVKIDIPVAVGKRYVVRQEMMTMNLDNGKGNNISWENFKMYALPQSNPTGS